jgi:hypothetical protein
LSERLNREEEEGNAKVQRRKDAKGRREGRREEGKAGEKKGTQRCKGARTQREGRKEERESEENQGEAGGGEE